MEDGHSGWASADEEGSERGQSPENRRKATSRGTSLDDAASEKIFAKMELITEKAMEKKVEPLRSDFKEHLKRSEKLEKMALESSKNYEQLDLVLQGQNTELQKLSTKFDTMENSLRHAQDRDCDLVNKKILAVESDLKHEIKEAKLSMSSANSCSTRPDGYYPELH
jgi:hypothetical protein